MNTKVVRGLSCEEKGDVNFKLTAPFIPQESPMPCKLIQIIPQYVCQTWPDVEPFLGPAMEHSAGEYSLEQLKGMLTCGQQSLLVFWDGEKVRGAVTVATEQYPNATVAYVTSIGGRHIAVEENFQQLVTWCRGKGYTCIRGAAFPAVARLWQRFKAKEIYRVVEIKL